MDAYRLLLVMSRPESGISDYWRTRITNLLGTVPQEPRVYAEVVEDEPVVEEDELQQMWSLRVDEKPMKLVRYQPGGPINIKDTNENSYRS